MGGRGQWLGHTWEVDAGEEALKKYPTSYVLVERIIILIRNLIFSMFSTI